MYRSTRPWKALKVAGLGEKVLRQKCRLIKDPTSDEMQDFAMNAMFTCIRNNAFGISAPQLYRPIRMFVIRDYSTVSDPSQLSAEQHMSLPLIPYFNPRIESRSRKMMGEFESCLSDPWNVAFVARPHTIGISYLDGFGKYQEKEISGWEAQVFQHEYDHLDGKTMADMCTQKGLYMSKDRYKRCEAYWKKVEKLPDFDVLAKASQLLSNGGYWGPEAEDSIEPEDLNLDALKSQMRLFLQFYDKDIDPEKLKTEDLTSLAEEIIHKLQHPSDVSSLDSHSEQL